MRVKQENQDTVVTPVSSVSTQDAPVKPAVETPVDETTVAQTTTSPVAEATKVDTSDEVNAIQTEQSDNQTEQSDDQKDGGQKREARGRSRRSPRHVRAAGQRRKKEQEHGTEDSSNAVASNPQDPENSAPLKVDNVSSEVAESTPSEEAPTPNKDTAAPAENAIQDELQFDVAQPEEAVEETQHAVAESTSKPTAKAAKQEESAPEQVEINLNAEEKQQDPQPEIHNEEKQEPQTPSAEVEADTEAKVEIPPEAQVAAEEETTPKDDAAAEAPSTPEVKTADVEVKVEAEASTTETVVAAVAVVSTTPVTTSSLGRKHASFPMALPETVDATFSDAPATEKADSARPALNISGKTASTKQASSSASAPATLPGARTEQVVVETVEEDS